MTAQQSDTVSLLKSHNPFSSYLEIAADPVMYSPVSCTGSFRRGAARHGQQRFFARTWLPVSFRARVSRLTSPHTCPWHYYLTVYLACFPLAWSRGYVCRMRR